MYILIWPKDTKKKKNTNFCLFLCYRYQNAFPSAVCSAKVKNVKVNTRKSQQQLTFNIACSKSAKTFDNTTGLLFHQHRYCGKKKSINNAIDKQAQESKRTYCLRTLDYKKYHRTNYSVKVATTRLWLLDLMIA